MIAPNSGHASAIRGVVHCYLLGEMERLGGSSLPANPAADRPEHRPPWFIHALVRKEAVISSQIEGTRTTLLDLSRKGGHKRHLEPELYANGKGPGKDPTGMLCVKSPVSAFQWCRRKPGGSMKEAGLAAGKGRSAIAVVVLGAVQSRVPAKRNCICR